MKTKSANNLLLLSLVIAFSVPLIAAWATAEYVYKHYTIPSQTKVEQINRVSPAEVMLGAALLMGDINIQKERGTGTHSAIIIGRSGTNYFAVTCNHCIESDLNEGVRIEGDDIHALSFTDGKPIHVGRGINFMARDNTNDIAIFNFHSDEEMIPAILATEEEIANVKIFDHVFTIGSPMGLFPTITEGRVSSTTLAERSLSEITDRWSFMGETNLVMRLTSPIAFGNSGGGVFSDGIKLIGITKSIGACQGPMGAPMYIPHVHYAIKITAVLNLLKERNLESIIR